MSEPVRDLEGRIVAPPQVPIPDRPDGPWTFNKAWPPKVAGKA